MPFQDAHGAVEVVVLLPLIEELAAGFQRVDLMLGRGGLGRGVGDFGLRGAAADCQ
jgi:hypothetical protein